MAVRGQKPRFGFFTPGICLALVAAFSSTLLLRYLLFIDIGELATHWMQDDAFYYFQPAWLYKTMGFFTFDGINKTYGFHPLWMIMLTLLAHTTTDKIFFLREALLLSGIVYITTGIAIYFLLKRFLRKWIALLPAAVWILNTDIQNAFVSGMENSLVALLLVCLLIGISRWHARQDSIPWILLLGFFAGLLFLARVSTLIAFFLLAGMLFYNAKGWVGKIRTLSMVVAAFVAAVLPWSLYAFREFGTFFPNSGTQKLVGSYAAMIASLHGILPSSVFQLLAGLLPAQEQLLLTQPSALLLPGISDPLNFVFGYLPARTYSFGFFTVLRSLPPAERSTIRIIFYTAMMLGVMTTIILGWMKRKRTKNTVAKILKGIHLSAPIGFLLLLAAVDLVSLALLLPAWLHTAWYNTAETLACLLLPAVILNGVNFTSILKSRKIKAAGSFALVAALLAVLFVSADRLSLRHFTLKPEHTDEAWIASSWINDNLPAGSRIGSWSSGLSGFFVTESSITNLDGLANSPEFVREVFVKGKLFGLGLSDHNAVWQYIQAMHIRYLADSEFESRIGAGDFFGCIPHDRYTVVYRGMQRIDWHEPEGKRVFSIVQLNY